jgi:Fe-S-cluster containining protein
MGYGAADFLGGSSAEMETQTRRALREILYEIQSPSTFESVWHEVSSSRPYRELLKSWECLNRKQRVKGWQRAARVLEQAAYATRPYCLQCGTCCRKGSPSLFRVDLPLVLKGVIKRSNLITLRRGEICFSNESNQLIQLPREQVKIPEKSGTRECLFFQGETKGCEIYESRPLQCRTLECWNPDGFTILTESPFLTRLDLLSPQDPILPVIKAHEEKCDLLNLEQGLKQAVDKKEGGLVLAAEALGFDRHTRDFLGEKYGLRADHLGFLLGRPLAEVAVSLGYRISLDADGRLQVSKERADSGLQGA